MIALMTAWRAPPKTIRPIRKITTGRAATSRISWPRASLSGSRGGGSYSISVASRLLEGGQKFGVVGDHQRPALEEPEERRQPDPADPDRGRQVEQAGAERGRRLAERRDDQPVDLDQVSEEHQ